uniref:Uncharacterized protein n=1 Tax=viral metagenome TaxID=1070528 RepID=A0A6C0J0N6_9ZZZZ
MQVSILKRQRNGIGQNLQVVALKVCLLLNPKLIVSEGREVGRTRLLVEFIEHAFVQFLHHHKGLFGDNLVVSIVFVRVDAERAQQERFAEERGIRPEVDRHAREVSEDPERHVVPRHGLHGRARAKRGRVVARFELGYTCVTRPQGTSRHPN